MRGDKRRLCASARSVSGCKIEHILNVSGCYQMRRQMSRITRVSQRCHGGLTRTTVAIRYYYGSKRSSIELFSPSHLPKGTAGHWDGTFVTYLSPLSEALAHNRSAVGRVNLRSFTHEVCHGFRNLQLALLCNLRPTVGGWDVFDCVWAWGSGTLVRGWGSRHYSAGVCCSEGPVGAKK